MLCDVLYLILTCYVYLSSCVMWRVVFHIDMLCIHIAVCFVTCCISYLHVMYAYPRVSCDVLYFILTCYVCLSLCVM